MSLISRIQDAIACDDDDQSDRLQVLYENADAKGKEILDDALICLCGWSFATMIGKRAPHHDAVWAHVEREMEDPECAATKGHDNDGNDVCSRCGMDLNSEDPEVLHQFPDLAEGV